jgi:hypothetical protein
MSVNIQINSDEFNYYWNLLEKISKTSISKRGEYKTTEYFWETEIEHRQKYISVKFYRYLREYEKSGQGFYQQLDDVFVGCGNDFIEAIKETLSELRPKHCKELKIERIKYVSNV